MFVIFFVIGDAERLSLTGRSGASLNFNSYPFERLAPQKFDIFLIAKTDIMTPSKISPVSLMAPRKASASKLSIRSSFSLMIVATLAISACATKPERRGPPSGERGAGHHAKSSGTFLLPVAALFIDMDTDGDRATTRAEMEQGIQTEWAKFDRSPSGVDFTPWVIETFGSPDATPNLMSFDHNFNGVVTEDEFSDRIHREFRTLDKNNDGRVERPEMLVAFTAQQGERSRQGGESGRPKRGQGGGRPSR